ncbi:MAG: MarR family transcriptional regulator [Saccharospirillaceae bacterium]|nr:MarR family transcriptional regulator [Saccharospirillaceae bacterium]MCD8531854.1 MarR family transcriptional regulator [Saccharospirillaceae bacterium]
MKHKVYPQLHLDNQLCFSVYSLSRLITQAYQPLLKHLELTYPQYLVMLVLWQAQEEERLPVSVKYLCEQLLLDTGTVTPLLKRMETSGLLIRSRSHEDERVVLVALTERGLLLREQAASVPLDILCATGVEAVEALSLRERLQGLISRWRGRSSC